MGTLITVAAIVTVIALHRNIGILLFGRRKHPVTKLTEHPELCRDAHPTPKDDEIVRRLEKWQPTSQRLPEWTPFISSKSKETFSATIEEINVLFGPIQIKPVPYFMLDNPPTFPVENAFPQEPEPLQEDYAEPHLSLPFWPTRFRFLNYYVKAANQDLIDKELQLQNKRLVIIDSAKELNTARRKAWESASSRHRRYEAARYDFETNRDKDIDLLRRAKEGSLKGDPRSIELHYDLVLSGITLPSFIPRQSAIRYEPETRILLLEHQFPEINRLQVMKVVLQSHGPVQKPASQTARKNLVHRIHPALCLQLARVMAEADCFNVLDAIAVNGWVDFFDRATGHPKRAYSACVLAKKEALLALRVETADLVTAFKSLSGAHAGESYEISPVMPSLHLHKDDPRFVASKETIAKMAKGENLAAMDWEDFEHLVRELFEREFASAGAEVKITRASRDSGVDAIIFDPDPLRGGKIVIQAKRYTIPVDVSAVRDLYGTVHNEGANTGILVTTSHFGADAYEFAQNKPLKLINGAQLLGLLDKAGYRFRIDLDEARAILKQQ